MTAKKKESICIPSEKDMNALYDDVALMYGTDVLFAMCKIFGEDFDNIEDTVARLERLRDPSMAPLPPHVDAPARANNPLQATLIRQQFQIRALERKDKASELWRLLNQRTKADHLNDFVINAIWEDDKMTGFLSRGVDVSDSKCVVLCACWGIPDYLVSGITRATVGDWKRPCVKGLKALETLLKMVPKIEGPHRGLLTDPPPPPPSPKEILEPVEAEHDAALARFNAAYESESAKADAAYDRERAEVEAAYSRESETIKTNYKARRKQIEADNEAKCSQITAAYDRAVAANRDDRKTDGLYDDYLAAWGANEVAHKAALEAHEAAYEVAVKGCRARYSAGVDACGARRKDRRAAASAKRTNATAGAVSRFKAVRTQVHATGKLPE